jgi:hypothetical protein
VFRNGQLLNNDQYNLTDTNKITIVSTSFKLGANYTVATVSGIGSVGSAQAGNPIYPEAGIALSTGTTWTTSITNNSSNWNTAFTDRLKWDGGSTGLVAATGRTSLGGTTIGQSMFTLTNPSAITFPQFNADNTITALSAASFRSAIGAGTVTSVTVSGTLGNPLSITNTTTTPVIELLSATTGRNGYLTSTDWTTFNNKFSFSDTSSLNLTLRFGTKLNYTDTSFLFTQSDTNQLNLTSRFAAKQNTLVSGTTIKTVNSTTLLGSGNLSVGTLVGTDTVSLSNRINLKLNTADTSQLNLTSRFSTKLNISDTSSMLTNYRNALNTKLNISDTTLMLSKYLRKVDTASLSNRINLKLNISDTSNMLTPYLRKLDTINLSNRINTKLNISDTASMLTNYNSRINLKVNISDTAAMLLPYLKKADTTSMLLPYFRDADTSTLNLTSRLNTKLNIIDTTNMLLPYLRKADTTSMLLPYFKKADTTLLNLTSRFAAKQNNITLTTTGTSGLSTFNGTTLNIPNYTASGGTGTVTSVGLTAPSIFNVGGSPVTTSGTLALTYSGTALPLLNGGTGATTADGALTNLGATAQGKLLFGLQNTVSEKFIKVNTDNTITLLNAADTRTAIGATTLGSNLFTLNGIGTISFPQINANNTVTLISDTQLKNIIGAGSVSSVEMSVPTFLSVSGSPVTSSGTLAVSLSGVPLPVLNGGTGGANAADARNELGAACKSCTETLTGNKTFSGTVTLSSVSGTATSVIGRSSTGQVVGVTIGTGLSLSSGTLSINNKIQDINQSTYTIASNDLYIANFNSSTTTITLPSAASNTYRELKFHNRSTGAVNSSPNVISLTGSSTSSILSASSGKWATLVSDGTDWRILQAN